MKFTKETFVEFMEKNYEIGCMHSVFCSKNSGCDCFERIANKLWNKFVVVLNKDGTLQRGTIENEAEYLTGIFEYVCSNCIHRKESEESSAFKTRKKLCFSNMKAVEGPQLVSSIIDPLLSNCWPELVGFRKVNSTLRMNGLCFNYKIKHCIDIYNRADASSSHSVVHNRVDNFIRKFLPESNSPNDGKMSPIREQVETLVESYLTSKFHQIKCTKHLGNCLIECRSREYDKQAEAWKDCRDIFIDRITSKVIRSLIRIADIERYDHNSRDLWEQFFQKVCMKCYASRGEVLDANHRNNCKETFMEASSTFAGLVRFLIEAKLFDTNIEIPGFSNDELHKRSAWMLSCPEKFGYKSYTSNGSKNSEQTTPAQVDKPSSKQRKELKRTWIAGGVKITYTDGTEEILEYDDYDWYADYYRKYSEYGKVPIDKKAHIYRGKMYENNTEKQLPNNKSSAGTG